MTHLALQPLSMEAIQMFALRIISKRYFEKYFVEEYSEYLDENEMITIKWWVATPKTPNSPNYGY